MSLDLDRVRRLSGQSANDFAYLAMFRQEVVGTIKNAASVLSDKASLRSWGGCVRADIDSSLGLITALTASLEELREFFALKPEIAKSFTDILDSTQDMRAQAHQDWARVNAWLPKP